MPSLSTDLVIGFVMVMVLLYGLLLGHNKIKTFALSVFVGIVIVLSFADGLFSVLKKANLTLGGKVNLPAVKIGLFALPVIALEFGKKEGKRGGGNLTVTLLLCAATAALLVSSVFSFLDAGAIEEITKKSIVANWIYSFRLVWLAAVPIILIVDSFASKRKHH